MSHPQAYLTGSEVVAASPSLGPSSLALPDPGGDALLVTEVDGHGWVAARFSGELRHVVTQIDRPGIELWNAPFWRTAATESADDLGELAPGPELPLPSGAPGVREALL